MTTFLWIAWIVISLSMFLLGLTIGIAHEQDTEYIALINRLRLQDTKSTQYFGPLGDWDWEWSEEETK